MKKIGVQKIEMKPQEITYCTLLCTLCMVVGDGFPLAQKASCTKTCLDQAEYNSDSSLLLSPDMMHTLRIACMIYGMFTSGHPEALAKRFGICLAEDRLQTVQNMVKDIHRYVTTNGVQTKKVASYFEAQKQKPAQKLYISDCHFNHPRINYSMDKRGFADVEELNSTMERCWNDHVTNKDEVFILGDFSMGRGNATNELLRRLHGKKHLIIGNHDKFLKDPSFDKSLFLSTQPYLETNDRGRRVVLSHYPIMCYNGQYKTAQDGNPITYMLYGHVHNTHDEHLIHSFIEQTKKTVVESKYKTMAIPCQMINCFCMFSGYVPLSLDDWIVLDTKRRKKLSLEIKENK